MGLINQPLVDLKNCKNRLKDEPCFVLGNGPSVSQRELSKIDKFFSIGVNRIFKIYHPTILFWQDQNVWRDGGKIVEKSPSVKVCAKRAGPSYFYNFEFKDQENTWMSDNFEFFGPMNSGGNAIQLASFFGCNPIILLGFDCKCSRENTNFYGKNTDYWGKEFEWCVKHLEWIKSQCDKEIISCGENKVWDKSDWDEVIIRNKKYMRGRKQYLKMLSKIF